VAAGLSGPGRFRFGGLRDFILGVRFVDGAGRLLRMGGKVVKNAAGFDLPKFFVGSLGRFGVLGEITFKVFPRPTDSLTLKLPMTDPECVTQLFAQAANSRWELDAMDWQPDGQSVCLRLAGPLAALEPIAREIIARWPGEILGPSAADKVWSELREFRWAPADDALIKIALTVSQISGVHELVKSVTGARLHVSAGGDLAFVSLPATTSAASLDEQLGALGLSAVTLHGSAPLWLGPRARPKLTQAVKDALDPEKRFPSLDD
jgi:glycolate oxidase FAD binding subunit